MARRYPPVGYDLLSRIGSSVSSGFRVGLYNPSDTDVVVLRSSCAGKGVTLKLKLCFERLRIVYTTFVPDR